MAMNNLMRLALALCAVAAPICAVRAVHHYEESQQSPPTLDEEVDEALGWEDCNCDWKFCTDARETIATFLKSHPNYPFMFDKISQFHHRLASVNERLNLLMAHRLRRALMVAEHERHRTELRENVIKDMHLRGLLRNEAFSKFCENIEPLNERVKRDFRRYSSGNGGALMACICSSSLSIADCAAARRLDEVVEGCRVFFSKKTTCC